MGFGLEIEVKNVRLKDNIRVEQRGNIARIPTPPFPFGEIRVISPNNLKGRLLTRFSNIDGTTPTLDTILRAIKSMADFSTAVIKVGSFYELKVDVERGIVVATGLADMRTKTFKLSEVRRLDLGKIWRQIYGF